MITRLRGATAFFFIVTLLFAAAAVAAVDIKDRERKGCPVLRDRYQTRSPTWRLYVMSPLKAET